MNISIFDLVVLRGYGVFDFIRSHNRKYIWLNEHLERLELSASDFGIDLKYSKHQITGFMQEALTKNPDGDVYVRILLSGGISEDTLSKGRNPTFAIIVNYCQPVNETIYTDGVAFKTFAGPRRLPNIKSTNYTSSMFGRLMTMQASVFIDILLTDDAKDPVIYEGAVNNVLFISGSNIISSPENTILRGIMRSKVIEAAQRCGLKYVQKIVYFSDLKYYDEILATNSSLGVYPIVRINEEVLFTGPGKYSNLLKKEIDQILNA